MDFSHTSTDNDDYINTSLIDHFLFNRSIMDSMDDAGVIHNIDNDSDHWPIYCVIRGDLVDNDVLSGTSFRQKPSWSKSSEESKSKESEEYKDVLAAVSLSCFLLFSTYAYFLKATCIRKQTYFDIE